MRFGKIGRGIGHEFSVATTDQDDCIYAHPLHVAEIIFPFCRSPVLVWDIVTDLINKGPGDQHA
jgi:hypothetical protein